MSQKIPICRLLVELSLPLAQVTFDDEKTTGKALTEATKNAGYPSAIKT